MEQPTQEQIKVIKRLTKRIHRFTEEFKLWVYGDSSKKDGEENDGTNAGTD